jgi:dGTPase
MTKLDWDKLLTSGRFSHLFRNTRAENRREKPKWLVNTRTETERDHDRIVYASPVRRLADKTQVFPLERNDSVRNRLTHSHEVSNLARSIGVHLVSHGVLKSLSRKHKRNIPAMLAAVGLAHDLGNPPFGHNGEEAIRSWMKQNSSKLFEFSGAKNSVPPAQRRYLKADLRLISDQMRKDFLMFEGNAQTMRVVTQLQVLKDDLGLNLTFGSLAALMKYTVGSGSIADDKDRPARKKIGYFCSEREVVKEVFRHTGLKDGIRHPLAYIMEACDDIAYSVIDAEDSVKKQLVSFTDLVAWLEGFEACRDDELTKWVVNSSKHDHEEHRHAKLSSAELNDVSMQKFRVHAIHGMISAVIQTFEANYEDLMAAKFKGDLISKSKAAAFCKALKKFDYEHGYKHRRVLEIELKGYNVLHELMDMLWRGISERTDFRETASDRTCPFSAYAYSRISENYRRVFENQIIKLRPDASVPVRYRELQLLTDMVSGMTDSFALGLCAELKKFHVGASTK